MARPPLTKTSFTLDTSGIAGFFGGDEAVSAMSTVHFFSGRWLLGWYNSPGSYTIAKRYGSLAKGRLWRGLFLGDGSDPVEMFGLGGKKGPRFVAAESGTNLAETEHLAYLLTKRCQDVEMKAQVIPGERRKKGSGINVSVVDLRSVQIPDIRCRVDSKIKYTSIFLALLTISLNIAVCVVTAIYREWYSFAMVLLGIAANGISCLVIGSGDLELVHSQHSKGAPRGDGVLINGKDMIVLLGAEGPVNFVTKGSFFLDFSSRSLSDGDDSKPNSQNPVEQLARDYGVLPGLDMIPDSGTATPLYRRTLSRKSFPPLSASSTRVEPSFSPSRSKQPNLNKIGFCALLLVVQFLLQLLLIPQSSLFGQILFLFSLAVSWAYNTYLASLDNEKLQIDIIARCLDLGDKPVPKYNLATWTGAAIFVAYVLKPTKCKKLLDSIIPNTTDTWDKFKEEVVDAVKLDTPPLHGEKDGNIVSTGQEEVVDANVEQGVVVEELIKDLRVDLAYALKVYSTYVDQRPSFSHGKEKV